MSLTQLLSDLQLAIMRVLWREGEATVADVHLALADRGLAPTTIATVLSRLEKRELVKHRRAGRQFIYMPAVSAQDVRPTAVDELTQRVFEGDVTNLVSHLLLADDIRPGDLARVKALIEEREREFGGDAEGHDDDA